MSSIFTSENERRYRLIWLIYRLIWRSRSQVKVFGHRRKMSLKWLVRTRFLTSAVCKL